MKIWKLFVMRYWIHMSTSRLEAFSDGVMAVIITIMVLELRPPGGPVLSDLMSLIPKLLVYVLSFVFIGTYWNNHHQLLRTTKQISARIMWANLNLLFWLSLMPLVTAWIGEFYRDTWPAATYGIVGAIAGLAYFLLVRAIASTSKENGVAEVLSSGARGKISVGLYVLGTLLAFVSPLLSYASYALVAVMWFVPDKRLGELMRRIEQERSQFL